MSQDRIALVADITARLGGTFRDDTFKEHSGQFNRIHIELAQPRQMGRLQLTFDAWKHRGRIIVRGMAPSEQNSNHLVSIVDSITVAEDRGAEKIAADIERRLIPDYLLALERRVEQNRKDREQKIAKAQLLEELATAAGTFVGTGHMSDERFTRFWNETGQWAEVRVCSDSVSIETRGVRADKAKRILAILAE
jgi:hypothetical protein